LNRSGLRVAEPKPSRPELRIFVTVPSDHIVHAVSDKALEPLLRPGEVAVVTDQPALYPEDGGWYLVEFVRGKSFSGREHRMRDIVEAYQGRDGWYVKAPAKHAPWAGFVCSDGPYDLNSLTELVLGRVVGIYRPNCANCRELSPIAL